MFDIKRLFLAFSPFLLIILYPFHIHWSSIHPKLGKYGLIDNYLVLSVFSLSIVLLFDFYLIKKEWHKYFNKKLFFALSIILSLIIRLIFFDFESLDYQVHLSKWYDYIKSNGRFSSLSKSSFSDYNPSYLYFLVLISYLPIPKLYAIKLISLIFDFLAAHLVYKIIKLKHPKGWLALLAAFALLFAPTVIINSSLWGQCDIIYTYFILWSLYYFLKKNTAKKSNFSLLNRKFKVSNAFFGLLFFSIALMFKLQAVFFILILIYFYIERKLKLSYFLMLPLVWLIMILPTWILGREFIDLLLIYPRQAISYPELSLNAPNIYNLIPNAPFHYFHIGGILFTSFVIICFMFLFLNKNIKLSKEQLISLALISVILIPYLLPKMHERYFFMADILAIIYAFYYPKRFYVPILMILISFISYTPFLFRTEETYFPLLSFGLGVLVSDIIYKFFKEINIS